MKKEKNITWVAVLFLAPNFLGFLIFTCIPVITSLAGSFTTWSLKPSVPLHFVGLDNYLTLLKDKNFYFYLYNTLYLMLGLPVAILGSLVLAAALSQDMTFRNPCHRRRLMITAAMISLCCCGLLWCTGSPNLAYIMLILGVLSTLGIRFQTMSYRTFFYLPHFTAGAGTIILWSQLYNPNFGLINQSIEALYRFIGLDLEGPGWLTSTRSILGFLPLPDYFNNDGFGLGAREAIMIMGIWGAVGGNNMLLYMAGISNIPPALYEAAEVDGANGWGKFCHITVPQLAPTTFFITVMGVIHGLQGGFEQARIMTEGGPAGITTTLSYYIYIQGFERMDMAYGSSIAWVLFVMILGMTLLNWRYGNREVAD